MAQIIDSLGSSSNDNPNHLLESLGRLSKKTGVLATMVLDRSTGAILTTTGTLSAFRGPSSTGIPPPLQDDSGVSSKENQGVEEMAAMVWNFVKSTGGLIQGLDAEDDLKLIRLRTKKNELVIVPDVKYLLIVVHETPSA